MGIADKPLNITKAQATIRSGHGKPVNLPVRIQDGAVMGYWRPAAVGVHAINLTAQAVLAGGTTISRSAFLTLEVLPVPGRNWAFIAFFALLFSIILYVFIQSNFPEEEVNSEAVEKPLR